MAGADDDNTIGAAQFAELLAGQAAEVLVLVSLLAAGSQDRQAGDDEPWVRLAERLEALWRQFLQDRTEAFVEVWPDIARNLTNMLPLVSRGQPLFGLLAQFLPLLAAPEILRGVIESNGEHLVKWLEQLLADVGSSQNPDTNPARAAEGQGAETQPSVLAG